MEPSMNKPGGIEFWVNNNGRVRLFIVAQPDKSKAQALLGCKLPGVEFATWQLLPSGLITMLKMRTDDIREWSPLGPL
jgi:hypothetical protein